MKACAGGGAVFFAIGITYFWPTMLGVVSERVPRTGALGLGLMGAVGMATVGLVAAPQMGRIADTYAHDRIPAAEAAALFDDAVRVMGDSENDDVRSASSDAAHAVGNYRSEGSMPSPGTANALRAIIGADADAGFGDDSGGWYFSFQQLCCGIALNI